jgi:ribosomal-protein-alanine N-acetyltransferase
LIDLTTLPARLAPIRTEQGNIAVERIHLHHASALHQACVQSKTSVTPWLGAGMCPQTPLTTKQCITTLDKDRLQGYGITFLILFEQRCLGLGSINYIHPLHRCANLMCWLVPSACGKGLASALCQRLIQLAATQINLHRLELLIEPNNKAGLRLAHRLNASKEGLCRQRIFGRDALLYSILI